MHCLRFWFRSSTHPWKLSIQAADQDIFAFLSVFTASPQVSISDHTGQNSIMRVEGEELVLSCTAWGWPIPSVSWKRQDGEKDLSHFQNVTSITNSSQTVTLKIDHLLTTDRAQYVCEGNNSLNGSYATNQKLILVRVKGQFSSVSTAIVFQLSFYISSSSASSF